MKRLIAILLLLLLCFSASDTWAQKRKKRQQQPKPSPAASSPQEAIDNFTKAPLLKGAQLGFCVFDSAGNTIYQINKDLSLIPASTLKLFTTAAALEIFKEDYRFKTYLMSAHDTLVVLGSGDPTMASDKIGEKPETLFHKITEAIDSYAKPIKHILVDASCFGKAGVSKRWAEGDIGNWYAPPAYGISVFDDLLYIYYNTNERDSLDDTKPVLLFTQPDLHNLVIENQLKIRKRAGNNNYSIFVQPPDNYVKLTGTIPDNREQFRLRGALPDPADVFCDILADSLAARGYDIATTCAFYDNPSDYYSWQPWQVKPFYEHCSPPLSEIVQRINVSSNNHFAEHLVRALSYSGYGKQIVANRYGYNNKTFDALQTGIDAAKNVLGDCQIDLSSLVMYDGCGLSRSNRVTAQLLCKLLHYMRTKSAHREAFLASLPAAGVDGTVSSVLKNTSLHGKIIMKSGTMNGIKCYAGYYSAPDREYSFAVLVNHFKCSTEQTIKEIETLLLGVFTTQPDKQTKNAESRQP